MITAGCAWQRPGSFHLNSTCLTLTLHKPSIQKRYARSISGHQEALVYFQDLTVCLIRFHPWKWPRLPLKSGPFFVGYWVWRIQQCLLFICWIFQTKSETYIRHSWQYAANMRQNHNARIIAVAGSTNQKAYCTKPGIGLLQWRPEKQTGKVLNEVIDSC